MAYERPLCEREVAVSAAERLSLDHVFLAVQRGGPEAERLVDAGFVEGPPNTHPGQGTACRRFFFEGGYLELVWVEDPEQAESPHVAGTALGRRLGGGEEASRIGICLRLPTGAARAPVETWAYRAPYLPAGSSIPVAVSSSDAREPLLFFLPRSLVGSPATTLHGNGARAISRVSVTLATHGRPSPELEWLVGAGPVVFEAGEAEALTIELDGGVQGGGLDLDTPTPLVLRW